MPKQGNCPGQIITHAARMTLKKRGVVAQSSTSQLSQGIRQRLTLRKKIRHTSIVMIGTRPMAYEILQTSFRWLV